MRPRVSGIPYYCGGVLVDATKLSSLKSLEACVPSYGFVLSPRSRRSYLVVSSKLLPPSHPFVKKKLKGSTLIPVRKKFFFFINIPCVVDY